MSLRAEGESVANGRCKFHPRSGAGARASDTGGWATKHTLFGSECLAERNGLCRRPRLRSRLARARSVGASRTLCCGVRPRVGRFVFDAFKQQILLLPRLAEGNALRRLAARGRVGLVLVDVLLRQ
eukprot:2692158-Pleurochrysis_carterae.AAC.1